MSDYVLEGPKWAVPSTITWSFAQPDGDSFNAQIGAAYRNTVASALATWSQVANVQFQQVAPGTPGTDILLGWHQFGANATQLGETNYSFLGSDNMERFIPGTTVEVEDPAERPLAAQTDGNFVYANTSTTLYQIMLHEIGHALGLGHALNPAMVMYPSLGTLDRTLGSGDIAGIQSLYSQPAQSQPPAVQVATSALPTSPASSTTIAASPSTPVPSPPSSSTTNPSTMNQVVTDANKEASAVHRYFDTSNGTHFFTASNSEAASIAAIRPDLVSEGSAFMSRAATDASAIPIYRFFNTQYGTHFFTASADERSTVSATRTDMTYEGVGFYADSVKQAGDMPIYRFFDAANGTHLYTADAGERATISASLPEYRNEGVAFWAPSTHA